MARVSVRSWESAGWFFWLVVFALLSGPSIYFVWQYKYSTTSWAVPVILGLVVAAIGAGVLSSAVNYILQHRAKVRQRLERKQAKKRKK